MKKIYGLFGTCLSYSILLGCASGDNNSGDKVSSSQLNEPNVKSLASVKKIEELETKVVQLSKSLEAQKESWTEAKNQLDQVKNNPIQPDLGNIDLGSILGKMGISGQQLSDLNGQLSKQSKQLEALEQKSQRSIELSQEDLDILKQDLGNKLIQETIGNQLQPLRDDIDKLTGQLGNELTEEKFKIVEEKVFDLEKKSSASTQTDATNDDIQQKLKAIEELTKKDGSVEQLQRKIKDLQTELEKLIEEGGLLAELRGEVEGLKTTSDKLIGVPEKITNLETELGKRLTQEEFDQQVEIKLTKNGLTDLPDRVKNLEEKESKEEKPSTSTQTNLDEIQKRVTEIEKWVQVDGVVTNLQQHLDSLIKQLGQELTGEKFKAIETKVKELEEKPSASIQTDITNDTIEQRLSELEKWKNELTGIDDIIARILNLEEKLSGLTKEELDSIISRINELEECKNELTKKGGVVDELRQQIDKITDVEQQVNGLKDNLGENLSDDQIKFLETILKTLDNAGSLMLKEKVEELSKALLSKEASNYTANKGDTLTLGLLIASKFITEEQALASFNVLDLDLELEEMTLGELISIGLASTERLEEIQKGLDEKGLCLLDGALSDIKKLSQEQLVEKMKSLMEGSFGGFFGKVFGLEIEMRDLIKPLVSTLASNVCTLLDRLKKIENKFESSKESSMLSNPNEE